MKFSVLALDFDGTIAIDDLAEPQVLAAVDAARSRGIAVVLVTGRTLRHLRKDMKDLSMFDAVVAENGAVLDFHRGNKRSLCRAPDPNFIQELRVSGVRCEVGDCIVDADATDAPTILNVIRKLGLPLALIFNRSRVMVLPQGVSKATGLRETLNTMRLSLHNCLGIGDAENDYQMLDSCEVGVTVSWGSKSLLAIADDVVKGDGPVAVAAYLQRVLENSRLPLSRTDRRRILLGQTLNGRDLEVAVHEDIHPTKAWQDEIENALATMDGFIALMTERFHDSDWTDQEVGFAFARGVPIIAVRMGKDPYGFIGKFQALSSSWTTASDDILRIFIKNDRMFAAYVTALRKCPSWDGGNILATVLPSIEQLTDRQIDDFVAAYNETKELRGSFGFNGSYPRAHGNGLVHHLNRIGKRKFQFSSNRLIEEVT